MKSNNEITSILVNPEAIIAIFKDEQINLDCINIAAYAIDSIGNSITVAFDLKDFPKNPPKKWLLQNFNTVRIVLKMHDVEEVSCNYNINYNDSAYLLLERKEKSINLSIVKEGDIRFFKVKGQWLFLDKIEAYANE